jgi:hypothetical protein
MDATPMHLALIIMDIINVTAIQDIQEMELIVRISTNVIMQQHRVMVMLLVIIWMDLICADVLLDMTVMERTALTVMNV